MPAVSVIIPVYKVEHYIARCARALFAQTLEDIEYLFIDDCTPDRSIDVLKAVLDEFPNRKAQTRILRMPVNSGQAKVRMFGISQATGDYVIHCDSDDFPADDAYGLMYSKAAAENLDIVTCDYCSGDGDKWTECRLQFNPGKEYSDLFLGRSSGALWLRLIKKELLDGILPPVENMGEDIVITGQAVCRAVRFGHVSKPLYYYRMNSESICRTPGRDAIVSRWKSCSVNIEVLLKALRENYGHADSEPEIVFLKYNCRHWLEPVVHIPEYYGYWKNTYPEVDRVFLSTPGIRPDTKFWFVMIHLRLYRPLKGLMRGLKRIRNR